MKPGYHEIYSRYRDNITRGVLKPGDKVPAIRVLAEELKVARKTVETAYAILTGEGYLVSQGARGTRVNPDLLLPAQHAPAGAGLVSAARGDCPLSQYLARVILHRRTGTDYQRLQQQPAPDP